MTEREYKGPLPSSEEARQRMKRQRQKDTVPEKKIRSILHRMGFRFRVQQALLKGIRRKADIIFSKSRVVVFVDGCFWHGCPLHGTWPKANAAFWREKIETNRRRDEDTNQRLEHEGWRVIRVWEHEAPEEAAERIADEVMRRKKKIE